MSIIFCSSFFLCLNMSNKLLPKINLRAVSDVEAVAEAFERGIAANDGILHHGKAQF